MEHRESQREEEQRNGTTEEKKEKQNVQERQREADRDRERQREADRETERDRIHSDRQESAWIILEQNAAQGQDVQPRRAEKMWTCSQ